MATPDDTTPTPSALEYARAYAALGLRVMPIEPGKKYPAGIGKWQDAATTDEATITNWWTNLYRGHGIGLALGELPDGRWAFAVDIDGASHGVDGASTWQELCSAYPGHPPADTVEATTGGGGRHLIYAAPTEVRNGILGPQGGGIDIRGHGGQILVEPSIHPNGHPYSWADGHEPWNMEIADAPPWLVDMLEQPEPERAPTSPNVPQAGAMDRPGDLWAQTVSWHDLLTSDGWTLHHVDRQGEEHWTRPGKDRREGTSATTGYAGSDVLKVFSSSIPNLVADETYTKIGWLAATRYGGDHSAAASYLAGIGHHIDQPYGAIEAWTPANLPPALTPDAAKPKPALDVRYVDSLAHNMPDEPPVLVEGMLRRGEMCVIGAPRAIGKTWFGMNLAQLLAAGEGSFLGTLPIARQANVLYLQGELDQWGSATRWHMLNQYSGRLPHIAESFDRVRIKTVKRRQQTMLGTEEYVDAHIDERIEAAIIEHDIDVVIIDPWATYFAGNENSNDETEAALDKLRDIILRHGTAFVILHHVRKGGDLNLVEPEDLWRGASRLADWASTRVTIVPHYSESQRKSAGLERREARRCVDVHFLRRSTPTDDRHAKLGMDGWWEDWKPSDDDGDIGPDVLAMLNALTADGGYWGSMAVAQDALGKAWGTTQKLVHLAAERGLVVLESAPRNATSVRLVTEVEDETTSHLAHLAIERSEVSEDVFAGQGIDRPLTSRTSSEKSEEVAKMPSDLHKHPISSTSSDLSPYGGASDSERSGHHVPNGTDDDTEEDDYLGVNSDPF
jgi:hypothetical protein